MVKIIGIFAILYVYYCEIDAEIDKLEFWNPTTKERIETRRLHAGKRKFDSDIDISDAKRLRNSNVQQLVKDPTTTEHAETRRVHAGKRKISSGNKSDGILLRSFHQQPAKFTMGFRADTKEATPYPKHGPLYIEPILKNSDSQSSDSEHLVDKINKYKHRNRDENKKHNADLDNNENKKTNMNKHHDLQRKNNTNKNYNSERNTSINKNYDREEKHMMDKKRKKDKPFIIEINKNKERSHNKDRNRNKEKNHSVEKNMDRNDIEPLKEEVENDHMNKKKHAKGKSRDKNKEKILNRGKDIEMVPMRIPKLQPESIQEPVTEKKKEVPVRPHRTKLRAHKVDDNAHIRSTRMIPMSLNQLDDGVGGNKETGSALSNLSPYALMTQIKQIMDDFPDANATFETLGRTVEYNDIIIIKITEKKSELGKYFRAGEESKYIDEVPEKKIIFIVHGLSVMGMRALSSLVQISNLKILLSYYFKHLDKFDIFIIPMANPDGYAASFRHISHSPWNKNVSPQETCPGVSLDRNFDVAWNSSREISSCSQLYPGPIAFSEIESKAVRDTFHYFGHKILAYIHVHSGTFDANVFKGDAILYPRGYTDIQSDDDKYIDLKGEIEEAMKNASFQVMSVAVETLHNWYGKVSGTSVDYASTVYGIPYALEFVMQLYEFMGEHDVGYYALTEIWSRLIDTSFNNMFKSLRGTNGDKRRK